MSGIQFHVKHPFQVFVCLMPERRLSRVCSVDAALATDSFPHHVVQYYIQLQRSFRTRFRATKFKSCMKGIFKITVICTNIIHSQATVFNKKLDPMDVLQPLVVISYCYY